MLFYILVKLIHLLFGQLFLQLLSLLSQGFLSAQHWLILIIIVQQQALIDQYLIIQYVCQAKIILRFRCHYIFFMSGKLDKEEQVQVVIRIKPTSKDLISTRSVYVSDQQEKTLVVETPNKKEYFVFDNIADQECSQQQIYEYIGQDAVKSSTDGYNCCIFAYGQTGAGKTFSILGNSHEIATDIYSESRGILPRLLSDLFSWCSNETDRFWIKCSYLEIYNEQIIDLLNPDLKLRQIREDFKRGVFVEGLSEENATNYEEAMAVLMRGVKNRKTSATSMNDESSRSHTIFTINIQSQIMKDQITKTRRSKINIVDLAGSERAKQTKVEGERLKQGCNINRSLHVLGNVINALVQSTKKKKHIPFRDSKLTHFLKDSLSGNSITKLLANIHPSKAYLGDTLSTLMFAKRAKILKMKVQVNENMTQNFEQLRKQIRKLREELAEARYIKNESKVDKNINESENDIPNTNIQKIVDVSNFDINKHEQVLQVFQQNELSYKALIQIYEQHMKTCSSYKGKRNNLNMHQEWKNVEKQNASYRNLLKNLPAFTKIFKQNAMLKNQKHQLSISKQRDSLSFKVQSFGVGSKNSIDGLITKNQLAQVRSDYQSLIKQMQNKFSHYIEELQQAYDQLENQNKAKQQRIKDLKKRKQLPPDAEELANQNQYLKLNILQLEDEISNYQQKQRKLLIQIKQLKKEKQKQKEKEKEKEKEKDGDNEAIQDNTQLINSKLGQIRAVLEKQTKQLQQERNSMLTYIDKIKQKLQQFIQQNKNLLQNLENAKQQNKGLKKKLHSLLKINNEGEITKDHNTYTNTFWTNQQSNISEEFQIFNQKQKNQYVLDKDQNSKNKLEIQSEQEKVKGLQLSNQIIKLHKSYNEEISKLKQQIKGLQRARRQLSEENYEILNKLRKTQSFERDQAHFKKQRQSKKQYSVQQSAKNSKFRTNINESPQTIKSKLKSLKSPPKDIKQ